MKKNGFTLIELLAVIVILAIIALIATPIILGIINDAREKANERSVELYAAAVKNGIAAYQLTGLNAPKSFSDLTIQYDGDVKCSVQELYEDGSFYLEGCKVNNGDKEYSYGTKQNTIGKLSSICSPSEEQLYSTNPLEAGYKYECKVDPNKPKYSFYVLTTITDANAISVNLIMDSNITLTGDAIKDENPTDKGYVAWITKEDYTSEEIGGDEEYWNLVDSSTDSYKQVGSSDKGPITAMNYLQNATQNWTNLNLMTIDNFETAEGLSTMGKEYKTYARIPRYSELPRYPSNSVWLLNYLEGYEGEEEVDGIVGRISSHGIKGYWTDYGCSGAAGVSNAILLGAQGAITGSEVYYLYYSSGYGVRPVITLDL